MTDEELSQRIFGIQEHILETIKAYGDISQFKEDVLNVIHFLLENQLTEEEITATAICEKNRYYMIQTEQRKRLEQQITELQMNLLDKDNRIKELEKAVEEKDKTIEKTIEKIIDYKDYLEGLSDECQQDCFLYHKVSDCNPFKDCKDCIKQYFEKKERDRKWKK